jgi:NADPH:quinone reductase-like Zn-dependent oxidoreductase
MSFEEDLSLLAEKFKINLAFDAVGGELTRRMMMAMPFGSTIVIYGNLSGEQPEIDHRSLVMNDKKVYGFYLGNWLQKQNLFTTVRCLLQVRKLLKDEVSLPVQAGFSLNHVQQAIDTYLSDMTAGKVLLIPDQRESDSKMQC